MTVNAVSRCVRVPRNVDGKLYGTANLGACRVAGATYSGGVLTLNGAFPSKPSAAPVYANDFESYSDGTNVASTGLTAFGSATGVTVTTSKAYSGSKSLTVTYPNGGSEYFPIIGVSLSAAAEVYLSCNFYWERYVSGTSHTPIFKLARAGAGTPYYGNPKFHDTIRPNYTTGAINGADDLDRAILLDDGTYVAQEIDNASVDRDAWHRLEYRYKHSTPNVADGAFQTAVDLIVNDNQTALLTRQAGSTATIDWIITPFDGFDQTLNTSNGYRLYMDNLYIDTTPIRVEVGNAATWADCTERVVAVPTAWNTSSITANLRPGALSGVCWVYVVDSSNTAALVGPVELP